MTDDEKDTQFMMEKIMTGWGLQGSRLILQECRTAYDKSEGGYR